ncbi:MAG: DUF4869 domain-containing protein [Lachnospiraceae bacterium]
MITIFKNLQEIPQNMEYIELNDLFFNQNTAAMIDERAADIIKKIDHAKLIDKYRISSRFDGTTVNVDKLSTSCKTILNVLYHPEKVFCLKECGNIALEILYGMNSGYVYSYNAMIPFDMCSVIVQDKSGARIITDYEELKAWWDTE